MYVGSDFHPQDQQESEVFGFNFANDLPSGETITTAAWSIEVTRGTDNDAAARLVGSPDNSDPSGTISKHKVVGLRNGVRYRIEVLVTSNQGNIVKLHSFATGASV